MGLALAFGGCAARPQKLESSPHRPPIEGQVAVALESRLQVGPNRIHFAVVRVNQATARLVHDERVGAEVRFFYNRPPQGDADASAAAVFIEPDQRSAGATGSSTNFIADLDLPGAGGGTLQFVIDEPNHHRTVIGVPVRVEPPTRTEATRGERD